MSSSAQAFFDEHFSHLYVAPNVEAAIEGAKRLGLEKGVDSSGMLEFIEALSSFDKSRTNDVGISRRIDHIVELNPSLFPHLLSDLFIGKVHELTAAAQALMQGDEFDGNLIIVNVGFGDACTALCDVFLQYNATMRLLTTPRDQDNPVTSMIMASKAHTKLQEVQKRVVVLSILSDAWREHGNAAKLNIIEKETGISIEPYHDFNGATTISETAEKYALCHEIAHVILGHTKTRTSSLFEDVAHASQSQEWDNSSHKSEFEADFLALKVLVGEDPKDQMLELSRAVLGMGLCFLTISLFSDFDRRSRYHPSVSQRLELMTNALRGIYAEGTKERDLVDTILDDVDAFCYALVNTHNDVQNALEKSMNNDE